MTIWLGLKLGSFCIKREPRIARIFVDYGQEVLCGFCRVAMLPLGSFVIFRWIPSLWLNVKGASEQGASAALKTLKIKLEDRRNRYLAFLYSEAGRFGWIDRAVCAAAMLCESRIESGANSARAPGASAVFS
jgi:hypothetical protein